MARSHIILIDGTQSRLEEGKETNIGILYKLLREANDPNTRIWYDPGVQGHGFWNWVTIASGLGINNTIRDAYEWLSKGYEKGDKIYFFGFSRGAYAVRSLAGLIDRVGLLTKAHASHTKVLRAFRIYEQQFPTATARAFCKANCHLGVNIEMIGVFDTVKALGMPYPILSRLAPMATEFHHDQIGKDVRYGFQALSLAETRTAYSPQIWTIPKDWSGQIEQVWFKGAHADIGGHVWSFPKARPLSNIPLNWMLERASICGVTLPDNWHERFAEDANAPMVGNTRGIAKFFLFRQRRCVDETAGQSIHPTAERPSDVNTCAVVPAQG